MELRRSAKKIFESKKKTFKSLFFCLTPFLKLKRASDICKSTGKRNPSTTTGCNNLQRSALERYQNSKDHILSINDLKLRNNFQVSFKCKEQHITIKPWKLQGGTLFSLKQCML